mgnify:FL=1
MNYLEVYFNGILKHNFPIQTDVISIGRASSNDLIIDNMGVSSHHAVIAKKDTLFYLEDLNSTNGTFVNNNKITQSHKIGLHDAITIGKHTIKFSEWSQSQHSSTEDTTQDTSDATVLMSKSARNNKTSGQNPQTASFHLVLNGEKTGITKLLLTKNSYQIGKAKDNEIRIAGWFCPAYIAKIDKIGPSFYIIPLKKNTVKLNNTVINTRVLLSPSDLLTIKRLTLKFSSNQ